LEQAHHVAPHLGLEAPPARLAVLAVLLQLLLERAQVLAHLSYGAAHVARHAALEVGEALLDGVARALLCVADPLRRAPLLACGHALASLRCGRGNRYHGSGTGSLSLRGARAGRGPGRIPPCNSSPASTTPSCSWRRAASSATSGRSSTTTRRA